MNRKHLIPIIILIIACAFCISAVSATCNCIIITDPSGKDPNGAAAGSMSFEENMFQSTFISSMENKFAVLSGGESEDEGARLQMICQILSAAENNQSVASAASIASGYSGQRAVVGGPNIGAAVGGSFDAYLIVVEDDGNISVTSVSGGLAQVPQGKQGAIVHLRDSPGSGGGADGYRSTLALEIGKMIRDGYSATYIMGEVIKLVSTNTGERYGGGAVNLASGVTTGDMFTPTNLYGKGFEMSEPYSKVCEKCGWSVAYPKAETYTTCPYDNSPLSVRYAYDLLRDVITVSDSSANVYTYGSDRQGLSGTTQELVQYSVKANGYVPAEIANSINKAINNGLIVGVNYVEPKDINVDSNTKSVGVYYTALPDDRTSPVWTLPIDSFVINVLGSIQTAIGLIIALLIVFRGRLLQSFQNRWK